MPTDTTAASATDLTPAARAFLDAAATNWLGVAKLTGTNGLGRAARRRMAHRLCAAGYMRFYIHGSDEFEITEAGRAALLKGGARS